MNTSRDDKQFVDTAKKLFDESVEQLDAATLSRLNRGRHEALAHAASAPTWLRWAPAAGIAAAAALAVVLIQGPTVEPGFDVPASVTDFEILLDEDAIEMFEDLEFFVLMDSLEANGNVG